MNEGTRERPLTWEEWKNASRPKRLHCWLRLRRHGRRVWHAGLHRLYRYAECQDCGWPLGMEELEAKEIARAK